MNSVNQSTFTNTEPSDHIDHKFREDLRLRQPLSQQPLDATDNVNVNASNNTTIGAIAGSVGHSLHNTKDKIVESTQNLNQSIKEKLSSSSNEGESMGAKMGQNLNNVKDKIFQAGSNLTENIKEKFSNSTADNRDMSNVNDSKVINKQKEGEVNNDDDEAQWVEEIVKEIETSNNSNESHIDHQFREDFRLRQPLVQQPLDVTDKNLQTDVASNTSSLVMDSAQHTLVDTKDKIIEVAHNLTETVKEKTSSTNQEVSSTNVDESSNPTLKDKVITSLENVKDSVSSTIANTGSAVLEVKDKTKEQVKEIKDSTVHALQASTDKVNQSLHNLGNTMIDIKDKSIEQAITLKDNVVHSLNTAGSTVNKSMRDVGSTLVNIKEKTIEQTTTLVNKLPTEAINNTLQSAKEQIVNVVHTIQDKANQSMDTSTLPKDNDETTNVNDNNNTTLKDKLSNTLETAKEQLSNVVQITQEKVNESSYLKNNDEKDKAVEILQERSPQPYEITEPIIENLPTSDNLVINNPPKDDDNINELKDKKDTSFHSDLNPNAPEFKPSSPLNSSTSTSTSTSPLMNEATKILNENSLNNNIQYKNKDLLNDFVEPHDKIVTCGVQDSSHPLPDMHHKNDPIHGSPMENVSEKFHSMVTTVSNMISNLWSHNNNNNNPNHSNQEIDPNMSQPQLLDTTKSGVIAKNQDNRHGLDLDN